jgi:hypothetical protein
MAPLPTNNTPVYDLYYTNGGNQHTQQVRTGVLSPAAFGTIMDLYYTGMASKLYATSIDFVTFRPAGSTIANIVTTGIEGNTYGSGTPSPLNEPLYVDFVGRSSGGRRVRFTQFGCNDLAADYRFVAGESAVIDAAIAFINTTSNAWYAIDGLKGIWKSYANTGLNAYWQRAQRP